MGHRHWIIAALGAAALTMAACTPLPQPEPALVVTTTADTFDGVCDTDCSLRDAIATSNASPAPNGSLPNRITLPIGTVVLSVDTPVEITAPVIISGANADLTTLDVSGSTTTAPEGVFSITAPVIINTTSVLSTASPAQHVLVSCAPGVNTNASLFNVDTDGLAATVSVCHTTLVNSEVVGPDTALTPRTLTATSSTIAVSSAPLDPFSVNIVSSVVTGEPGTSLTVHPDPSKINVPVSVTGSRFEGVGLELGATGTGTVAGNITASSMDLGADPAAATISVGAGTNLNVNSSTIHGGGSGAAIDVDGSLAVTASTLTTGGTTIDVDPAATASLRRSVVSGANAACSAPITSLGHNAVVGASCGVAEPTDQVAADEASLELGPVDRNGNSVPARHRLPAATSPLVDAIAPGDATDEDCPVDGTQGASIDARGVTRPQGAGCDIGSLELEVETTP